ncbi:MAG: trimeric intracellular cation channel family protein [Rickettsiales bacterium]|nr:trimeric intracellular cation channel family protein [Rickettsiales bacterium]
MSIESYVPDIMMLSSYVGGVAFALSGFLIGVRHQLDVMGIFIVSMLTANGGGAVRDVLIGRTPTVLTDMSGFLLVVCVIFVAWVFKLHKKDSLEDSRWFVTSDAIGLAAFSLTGAVVGIGAGLSIFGVMVLSFVTASGGGIIRDLMVNRVPSILSSDFYGTIAIIIALATYVLEITGNRTDLSMAALLVGALSLRLVAQCKGWQLPRIKI